MGEASDLLKDKINSLIHQGRSWLALNMRDVTYIDSSGLGQLIAAFATAKRQSSQLVLFSLGKNTHDLLSMTKLLTVFDTFDSEADAVRSLNASS